MRGRLVAPSLLGLAGWLIFLYLGGLIVRNSLGYFGDLEQMPFVEEKSPASDSSVWRAMLVAHVASGIVAFAATTVQFFRGVLKRWPLVHRWLGRIYVHSTLWVLCPSGIYLAFSAKGGWPGQSGFLLLGAFSFATTWRGWREMLAGHSYAHARWMIRSFAMATTAITFRVYHLAFAYADWPYLHNYVASLWLSILGNALAAEGIIRLLPLSANSIPRHHEIKPVASLLDQPAELASDAPGGAAGRRAAPAGGTIH